MLAAKQGPQGLIIATAVSNTRLFCLSAGLARVGSSLRILRRFLVPGEEAAVFSGCLLHELLVQGHPLQLVEGVRPGPL